MIRHESSSQRAISPVIATMLLVALTVAIGAGAHSVALGDIPGVAKEGSSLASSAEDVAINSDGKVQLVGDTPAETIVVTDGDGNTLARLDDVGETYVPPDDVSEITVIAEDSTDQVVVETREFARNRFVSEPSAQAPTDCEARHDGGERFDIETDQDLFCVDEVEADQYVVTQNIDASLTKEWDRGFDPLELDEDEEFLGNNHEIEGLYIDNSSDHEVGLFSTNEGDIRDVTLTDATIRGHNDVGGLVGENDGLVENVDIEASTIDGKNFAGGVVGKNDDGTVTYAASDGDTVVEGTNMIGGVIGWNADTYERLSSQADVSATSANEGQIIGKDTALDDSGNRGGGTTDSDTDTETNGRGAGANSGSGR